MSGGEPNDLDRPFPRLFHPPSLISCRPYKGCYCFLSYDETVDTWCVQAVSYVREKLTNQEPRKFRTTSYTMWYGNGPHSSWMWIKITFVLLFLRNKHQIYTFLCFKINYAYHMIKIKPHSYRTCLLSHGNSALRPRAVFQQTRPQLMWFYHYITVQSPQ